MNPYLSTSQDLFLLAVKMCSHKNIIIQNENMIPDQSYICRHFKCNRIIYLKIPI